MTIELTLVPNADAEAPAVVAIQAIGTLDKSDYEVFSTQLDELIRQHGKIRLFIELVDFKGWTPGAAWADVKLGFRHFGDIERIAVVGENRFQQGMTALAKPFTAAKVRYFDVEDRADADAWIQQDQGQEVPDTDA